MTSPNSLVAYWLVQDEQKAAARNPSLTKLIQLQDGMKKDYDLNSILRKTFRTKRKELQAIDRDDAAFMQRTGLADGLIKLLPAASADKMAARSIAFDGDEAKIDRVRALKRTAEQAGIFSSKKIAAAPRPSSRRHTLDAPNTLAEKSIKVQTKQRQDQLTKARQLGCMNMAFFPPAPVGVSLTSPRMTLPMPVAIVGYVPPVGLAMALSQAAPKCMSLLAGDYDSD